MQYYESPNAAIRQRARALDKKLRKKLVFVNFIMLLFAIFPTAISLLFNSVWQTGSLITPIVTFAISVIVYPVTSVGISRVAVTAWRRESVDVSELTYCLRDKGLLKRSLLLGLLQTRILRLFDVPRYLMLLLPSGPATMLISSLLLLALSIVSFWLSLRFTLAPYIFSLEGERSAFGCVAQSFRRMKGHVGRYIAHCIAVFWKLALVYSGGLFILSRVLLTFMHNLQLVWVIVITAVTVLAMLMLAIPFFPYVILSLAGFADGFLPSERNMRKMSKKEKTT